MRTGSTINDDLSNFDRSRFPAGRAHAIRPACRMMLRIMSGKMKAWNGNMEYQ
jgi:hypothetical protein